MSIMDSFLQEMKPLVNNFLLSLPTVRHLLLILPISDSQKPRVIDLLRFLLTLYLSPCSLSCLARKCWKL